jgi:hypothetical protein
MRCACASGAHVVDELQRLREDEAVERLIGNLVGDGEIGEDRRVRICRINVEDVFLAQVTLEPIGVRAVHDFEQAAADVARCAPRNRSM